MIDLHNHILFDWDDGPATVEKSLEMARQAVSVGTTIMAATPHRRWNGGVSAPSKVAQRVRELNDILALEGIPLTIVTGIEIPVERGIADDILRGDLCTVGGGAHVLIEPPFNDLPNDLIPAVEELLEAGFGAILAHPERNSRIQKLVSRGENLEFVSKCATMGCVIQLTSGSIIGRFGSLALAASRAIVAHRDWKIIIASDSHDPKERSPGFLAQARETVAEWLDDPTAAGNMVNDLPAAILNL